MNGKLLLLLIGSTVTSSLLFLYSLVSVNAESVLTQTNPTSPLKASTINQHKILSTTMAFLEPSDGNSAPSNGAPLKPVGDTPTQLDNNSPALDVPVVYRINREKFPTLEPSQQAIIYSMNQEYLQFYQSWNSTYPHDSEAWNKKMENMKSELSESLGNNASDVIH